VMSDALRVYSTATLERVAHIETHHPAVLVSLSHDGGLAVVEQLQCISIGGYGSAQSRCRAPQMIPLACRLRSAALVHERARWRQVGFRAPSRPLRGSSCASVCILASCTRCLLLVLRGGRQLQFGAPPMNAAFCQLPTIV
jgi:hypothetical protein